MSVKIYTACLFASAVFSLTAAQIDPEFSIELFDGTTGTVRIASSEMESSAVTRENGSVRIAWKGHPRLGPDFAAVAAGVETGDAVEWTFSCSGNASGMPIGKIAFPVVDVPCTDKASVLYSPDAGGGTMGWKRKIDLKKRTAGKEFVSTLSPGFRFVSVLNGENSDSWYLDVRDAVSNAGRFTLAKKSDSTARLQWIHDVPLAPSNAVAYRLPFTARVRAFRGDWFEAAAYYREWVKTTPRYAAAKSRDKSRVRDIGLWMWNRGLAETVIPPVERFQSDTGLKVALDWYWWFKEMPGTFYPSYWPPREGAEKFKADVQRLKRMGVFTQVYLNGMTWDENAPSWKDGGLESVAMLRDGSYFSCAYNRFNPNHHLANLCGEAPKFQARIRREIAHLVDAGFDSIYLDMIGCNAYGPCFNPAHRHIPGGGTHMTDGFRDYLGRIKRGFPGILLSTEDSGEAYVDIFDSHISTHSSYERHGWIGTAPDVEFVPVFQAVYHGCVAVFGNYAIVDNVPYWDPRWPMKPWWTGHEEHLRRDYPDQFAVEFSRGPVWGLQPSVHNFWVHHATNAAVAAEYRFICDTAGFYRDNREFLFDGEMCPPGRLECMRKKVDFAKVSVFDEKVASHSSMLPVVFHNVWRSPEGRVAAILVNWTREPQRWKLSAPDVSGEGILPPRSWKRVDAARAYMFSATDGDVTAQINALDLKPGDKVLFRRGDLFRGRIDGRDGVTYGAWGEGPLPTLCASKRNYADPALWKTTGESNVWRCVEKLHNVGIVLFDHDPQVVGALDRTFAQMRLPKRNEPFDRPVELDADLTFRNLFHDDILELRSDAGNPGERFRRIEIGEHGHCIWIKGSDITVENLHLTLSGTHGVGGSGFRTNITVRNCVIDWLGGSIIEGWKFGTTRFGNGVEIWGGCDGFRVENNWIYQVYDTGVTIQCNDRTDFVCRMANVAFVSNRIENCFWALEYYNARNAPGSSVENVRFADNICLKTGRGWGCGGREHLAPVLALGSSPPDVSGFIVERNIFGGSTGTVIERRPPAPENAFRFSGNVYRQHGGGAFHKTANPRAAADFSLDPFSPEYDARRFKTEPVGADTSAMLAERYGEHEGHVEELGLRKGDRVVILGDSLTNQGLGVRNGGYFHRLTNAIARVHGEGHASIVPLGFSGWHVPSWIETERTTRTKGFRYDTCGKFWDVKDVFDAGADVAVVFLGMNDILWPVVTSDPASHDLWVEEYRRFIAALRARLKPRRVLLCTISPLTGDPQSRKNEIRREMNSRIRALARDEKCGVVEIDRTLDPLNDEARRLWKSHLAGDFVHPSWGLGHAAIARAMAEAFGEWDAEKMLADDVRREAEKVLARADAFSVNQTALVSTLKPDAKEFDYEVAWYLKAEWGPADVAIKLPDGWRVIATNTVSVVPHSFEPRYFDGTRGYFTVRGAPVKAATAIWLSARMEKGKVFRKSLGIPAPWRARNNGGDWRMLSPSWDYTGWGNAAAVDPFQSFFGSTNETLTVFRRVYVPTARMAEVRLSTKAFSARLKMSVRVNGEAVGSRSVSSGKKDSVAEPIPVELKAGWNTLEVDCLHYRSQRQFLCSLVLPGGKAMEDALYGW